MSAAAAEEETGRSAVHPVDAANDGIAATVDAGASKWRTVAKMVAPVAGLAATVDAVSTLAATSLLTRALQKPPSARTAADIRFVTYG